MNKNLNKDLMIHLPSGAVVHPSRLIHKDGTLMWKHSLTDYVVPNEEAVEQHIIKTAQRLEELNSWVSRDLEVWQCLVPMLWYTPHIDELSTGYCVYLQHSVYDNRRTYNLMSSHILPHETLEITETHLKFQRC